jgi:hypothetical protein
VSSGPGDDTAGDQNLFDAPSDTFDSDTVIAWTQRSPVPATMFNPALIAVVLAAAANQFKDKSGFPMPWPMSYLVPPMVLHEPTRTALPKTSSTSLPKWVGEQAILTAGFPSRARHLAPHVREGLRFGLREQMLELVLQGTALQCTKLPKTTKNSPGDLAPIVRGAGMLGRIFARTGDAATVYAALRIRP